MDTSPTAHAAASEGARHLCDSLFAEIKRRLPPLERSMAKQWCGYYVPGRRRFAFVSHRRSGCGLEVWCAGDVDALLGAKGLIVTPRAQIRTGWERQFPARFRIDDESRLTAAVDLLVRVSYQAS